MKKLKNLLLSLMVLVLIPLTVFADSKEKINVYIYKGKTCGYCAKALEFFEGLDEEYQSYFNLVEKEVWYDEDNAAEMQEVAAYFNEKVNGVPYIIIGDKTFQGFSEEQNAEQIKAAIKAGYENSDGSYKDVVASIIGGEISKDDNNAAITIIVIIALVAGVGFLVYMAREDSSEEFTQKEVVAEKKETKKASTTKEEPKKQTKSKTTAKKSTATKKSTTAKKSASTKNKTVNKK